VETSHTSLCSCRSTTHTHEHDDSTLHRASHRTQTRNSAIHISHPTLCSTCQLTLRSSRSTRKTPPIQRILLCGILRSTLLSSGSTNQNICTLSSKLVWILLSALASLPMGSSVPPAAHIPWNILSGASQRTIGWIHIRIWCFAVAVSFSSMDISIREQILAIANCAV
jgi:hypothetical protein